MTNNCYCETCTTLADNVFRNENVLDSIAPGLRYIEILALGGIRKAIRNTTMFKEWMNRRCNNLILSAGAALCIPEELMRQLFSVESLRRNNARLSGSFLLWIFEATLQRDYTWKFPVTWTPGDIDVFAWSTNLRCAVRNFNDCDRCVEYYDRWYHKNNSREYGDNLEAHSNVKERQSSAISQAKLTHFVCKGCQVHIRYGCDFEAHMCATLHDNAAKIASESNFTTSRNNFPHCNPCNAPLYNQFKEVTAEHENEMKNLESVYSDSVPEVIRTWTCKLGSWKVPISVVILQRTSIVANFDDVVDDFDMTPLRNTYDGMRLSIGDPSAILHRKFEVDVKKMIQRIFERHGVFDISSLPTNIATGIENEIRKRVFKRMEAFAQRGYSVSLAIPDPVRSEVVIHHLDHIHCTTHNAPTCFNRPPADDICAIPIEKPKLGLKPLPEPVGKQHPKRSASTHKDPRKAKRAKTPPPLPPLPPPTNICDEEDFS